MSPRVNLAFGWPIRRKMPAGTPAVPLRLLGGAEVDFAYEALRGLRD